MQLNRGLSVWQKPKNLFHQILSFLWKDTYKNNNNKNRTNHKQTKTNKQTNKKKKKKKLRGQTINKTVTNHNHTEPKLLVETGHCAQRQRITLYKPGTIEQGDWKRTIDHYCIIIYEHTMLVAGVFLSKKLKTCPIMPQNRTKITFTPNTWAYIKLNTILMRFLKIKCCCSDWNNWYIWEKYDKLRCMIEC